MDATPLHEEELKLLEVRLNQLKLEYEKYFLGNRPTEPAQARAEIQKAVLRWSNARITNTALRFKFNSLNGRFQAFKRRWDTNLRQIDAGTYQRHVFKADLHDRERADSGSASADRREGARVDLFDANRDALLATGRNPKGVSREQLERAVRRQEAAIKQKFGCERVDFRVVVSDGRVKLKAAAG